MNSRPHILMQVHREAGLCSGAMLPRGPPSQPEQAETSFYLGGSITRSITSAGLIARLSEEGTRQGQDVDRPPAGVGTTDQGPVSDSPTRKVQPIMNPLQHNNTSADNGDQVTKVQDVFYAGREYQRRLDVKAFELGEGPVSVPLSVD